MSTKIYNGFRMIGIPSLEEVFSWANNLRHECDELAKEELGKQIAREACRRHDAVVLGELLNGWGIVSLLSISQEELARPPLMSSCLKYWNEILEQSRSPYRNPDMDFDLELSLISIKGGIVGMWHAEKKFYKQEIMKHPRVEPFAYWDNTDAPDGISAEEWEERGRMWDAALPRSYSPADRGISISIVSGEKLLIRNDLRDLVKPHLLPSLEERADVITHIAHTDITMKRLCRERGIDITEADTSLAYSLVAEAIHDTEGKEEVRQQIRENLQEISLDDLKRPAASADGPSIPVL